MNYVEYVQYIYIYIHTCIVDHNEQDYMTTSLLLFSSWLSLPY